MKKILLVALFLASGSAWAGYVKGVVKRVVAHKNGTFQILIDGSHISPPTCTSNPKWMVFTSSNGKDHKSALAVALSGQTTGKRVLVMGTGTCDSPNGGTWSYEEGDYIQLGEVD